MGFLHEMEYIYHFYISLFNHRVQYLFQTILNYFYIKCLYFLLIIHFLEFFLLTVKSIIEYRNKLYTNFSFALITALSLCSKSSIVVVDLVGEKF